MREKAGPSNGERDEEDETEEGVRTQSIRYCRAHVVHVQVWGRAGGSLGQSAIDRVIESSIRLPRASATDRGIKRIQAGLSVPYTETTFPSKTGRVGQHESDKQNRIEWGHVRRTV